MKGKRREYTVKMHVYRVELMLKRKNPCKLCPKYKGFNINSDNNLCWKGNTHWPTTACHVCKKFIGISYSSTCPCSTLGKTKAIELTYLAIEEYRAKENQS